MNFWIALWILIIIYLTLIVTLKWLSYKQIFLLILGGGVLLALLQPLYLSIGKEAEINLFFIKGNFQVNDFISSVQEYFSSKSSSLALFLSLIVPAWLEEFWKFYFFKKINKHIKIANTITTTMLGMFYVALGFSFFETGAYIYFLSGSKTLSEILELTFARGIISTFSHIVFSVIIGYFYGKVLFLKFQMVDNLEITKSTKWLKKFEKFPFLNIKTVSHFYAIKYMFSGFFLAILIHSIYNYFMSTGEIILAVGTILIGLAIFYRVTRIKSHNKNYTALKDKIERLREMQELKEKLKIQTQEQKIHIAKTQDTLKKS